MDAAEVGENPSCPLSSRVEEGTSPSDICSSSSWQTMGLLPAAPADVNKDWGQRAGGGEGGGGRKGGELKKWSSDGGDDGEDAMDEDDDEKGEEEDEGKEEEGEEAQEEEDEEEDLGASKASASGKSKAELNSVSP